MTVRRPALFDVVLALAVLAAGQVEAWVPLNTGLGEGPRWLAAATGVVAAAALAFRRVAPIAAAVFVLVPTPLLATATSMRLLFFGGLVPFLVVTYTLASTRRARRDLLVLLLPAATLATLELAVPEFHQPGELVFDWLFVGAAAGVGWAVGAREAKVEETETRAVALERTAVAEERARIARELHDVIAHAVSVIVVQAGAAEPLVDEQPERAREALRSIRATGSDALAEMRRMLGILREQGDELTLAPQPSVARLEPLLEQIRATGLDARLVVEGPPRPLPPGLDLAAFRIVQEALTNAHKHARATTVSVRLRYMPSGIELEIVDDGRGSANGSAPGGHGLVGMRERVALYTGDLTVGPRAEGGYGVRATLPAP